MRSKTTPKHLAPITGRKTAQIMRAAQQLFLEHGYTVTSMDGIAERANVSKATLYSYHKSKEKLFAAIVTSFLDRAAPEIMDEDGRPEDLHATLMRMGHAIVVLTLKPDDVAAYRMVVAEAARSPALGELYFQVGPQRLHTRMAEFLKQAMNRGELRRTDPWQAAEHFISLVMGNLHLKALLCVKNKWSPKSRDAIVSSGIDVFYRAYRSDGANRHSAHPRSARSAGAVAKRR